VSKFTTVPRVAASICVALGVCVVVVALVALARAQETPPAQRRETAPVTASPTPAPSPSATTSRPATDNHDLSITANVTARELLFEVVPNPTVEFSGQPRRDTVWEAERTNLPAQVQPGVTYRDIGIRLRITSVFADIERIVAEALGEIPVSDNNTTTQTLDPNAHALPQAASSTQTAPASSAQTTPAHSRNRNAAARRGRH
jgi:hypothetical protein